MSGIGMQKLAKHENNVEHGCTLLRFASWRLGYFGATIFETLCTLKLVTASDPESDNRLICDPNKLIFF